jgi:hypothetical protein
MSANRGGGGRWLRETVGPRSMCTPEHDRDASLIADAIRVLDARLRSTAASLNKDEPDDFVRARLGKTAGMLRAFKDVQRGLHSFPSRVLSAHVRDLCRKILDLREIPPLREATVPEVLRSLPLKPPGHA